MTRTLYVLFFLSLSIGITALVGRADPPLTNKTCPVLKGEPVDSSIFVEYEGKRVYLCCALCRKRFLENPTAYLANLPQFSSSSTEHGEAEGGHSSGAREAAVTQEEGHDRGEAHDHATSHGQEIQGIARAARFLGKLHPVVVHFPIALVMAAALAEILAFWTRETLFVQAARFSIVIAAIGAIATVVFGWAAGAFANYPGDLARVLIAHRWFGTGTGILIVVTALLSELSRRRGTPRLTLFYRFALLGAVILVGLTGHLGATLIYGPGYYTW